MVISESLVRSSDVQFSHCVKAITSLGYWKYLTMKNASLLSHFKSSFQVKVSSASLVLDTLCEH